MSEKLKGLLEKINQEGVQEAEKKARAIESSARKDAENIIGAARVEARKMTEDAKAASEKTIKAAETALRQAARDLILSLKEDVRRIFARIVAAETAKALSAEDMAVIIGNLIENYIAKGGSSPDIKVLLKKEDIERLKKTFISKLEQKLKDGIEFKPSQNISAGFSISFDKGKSFFDFSDEALAQALCAYLSPEIAALVK